MALPPDSTAMAVFCDFENVAIGVRDAKYDRFDIKRVLERLLLKGSIVVKKAYCDWERYKPFKGAMHEASFELIEIPHVRQSGKNSADIRLVVDALDLCYMKSHVNTFVIISGDSDFSPLVSKLRENAKQVIGVGVKQSTSDLLIGNCDEFIFYDDLVREQRRRASPEAAPAAAKRSPEEERSRKDDAEKRKGKAFDLVVETFEALLAERGDAGKIWPSMVKQAIKRRRPDFSESYFGFRTFGALLDEAQARGLLELGRDEKANVYVQRASGPRAEPNAGGAGAPVQPDAAPAAPLAADEGSEPAAPDARAKSATGRRAAAKSTSRRGRAQPVAAPQDAAQAPEPMPGADLAPEPAPTPATAAAAPAAAAEPGAPPASDATAPAPKPRKAASKRSRTPRRTPAPAGDAPES